MVQNLRERLFARGFSFSHGTDLEFSSLLVSYGMAREIGTVNDELARFVFDAGSGQMVPRDSLRATVVRFRGKYGICIESGVSRRLEIRVRGIRDLCHPTLSENADATYHRLVIFPEVVVRVAALQNIELVVIRPWAVNSVFGDTGKGLYETNFWELENNDGVVFASLLARRQLAFIGTHDLVAHIANLRGDVWPALARNATNVRRAIDIYLANVTPSISDLVLPYTAGVILDDLAQPPSYLSDSHQTVLDEVLNEMIQHPSPRQKSILLTYPSAFEEVIRLSRMKGVTRERSRVAVRRLADEIAASSAQLASFATGR
jgi:hypothetical protein